MLIPEGYGQVNIFFTGTALPTGAEVTFGIANPLDLTAEEVADGVVAAIGDVNFGGNLATGANITKVRVKLGPNDVGPDAEVAASEAGTGGAAGYAGAAVLVRKNTNAGGRSGRGRMYWPGLPESDIAPGGALDSGVQAAYQSLFDDFLDKLDTSQIPMMLLHGEEVALEVFAVTSLSVDSRAATQRRRQRR